MTRWLTLFALLSTLAACGVDGEPEAPPGPPGVSITGTVEFGVGGTF